MPDTNINTYDLPNYIGELFQKGRRPNATLQMVGGIGSWRATRSTEFAVGQQYEVPTHAASRAALEGAAAPDHAGVTRSQVTNITQIFHEKVKVTYTKQAATQQNSGLNIGEERNPVEDELAFQTGVKLELIARNLNWTMLNQAYAKPSTAATPRKTRGLLEAITTNVVSASADAGVTPGALTLDLLDQVMGNLLDAGAIGDGENVITLANTTQMRKLNLLFRTDKQKVDAERFIGGIRVRTVYTTFGVMNFALEQDLPQGVLVVANFDAMQLAALETPGKGVLFREALAKTGSTDDYQIYGEIGLDHGPEWMHAKLTDLVTTFS